MLWFVSVLFSRCEVVLDERDGGHLLAELLQDDEGVDDLQKWEKEMKNHKFSPL